VKRIIRFLANEKLVEAEAWELAPALDFIRRDLGLTGTKEGCREGDCGACAVLVGERSGDSFSYRAMPSCLLVLGELEGRHLVTIEGLSAAGSPGQAGAYARLTPVMRAIAEANASQCGFCSPGFVVSLSAYLLSPSPLSLEGAISAVEGNLCRCTGYGSIKRAAATLVAELSGLPMEPFARLDELVKAGVLPLSCAAFARGEIRSLGATESADEALPARAKRGPGTLAQGGAILGGAILGGGSDFLVRNPEPDESAISAFALLDRDPSLRRVEREGETLAIGAALSWREFFSNPEILALVPGIESFEAILASPLVRERATLGGNIANASPVGDLTSMLIALGANVRIEGGDEERELPLEKLFLGYKKLDMRPGEIISRVLIPAAKAYAHFNFEKVSKRERLDIAAVNSAAAFELEADGRVMRARISAGGVAPVPLLLAKASAFLAGKAMDLDTALEASRIAASEASPIGDVRGSADYRRRLLERLVLAHFIRLFPGTGVEEAIA
jgi:xanthine dehydrogenase small subunit